ncbi:MAG: hypothetical protein WC876_07785 [Candidatus Thermoplasmatota archaeon]
MGGRLKTMLLNLIEGTELHREACYLASVNKEPLHAAIERAVRMQAQLTRRLERSLEVRIWGGPPYDHLRIAEDEA